MIGSLKVERSADVDITEGTVRFEKIYYPIRIIEVYKGNVSSLTHLKKLHRRINKVRYISRLYVPSRISSCSLSLKKSKYYILMGQIHEGSLHHDLCNWRSLLKHVTKIQKKGLKKYYAEGCQCTIRTCPTLEWCKKSRLRNECRWVARDGISSTKCVDGWKVCKYNIKRRSCKWKKLGQNHFANCVKTGLLKINHARSW